MLFLFQLQMFKYWTFGREKVLVTYERSTTKLVFMNLKLKK